MKITNFSGLAFTVAVTGIPSLAFAQSYGQPQYGQPQSSPYGSALAPSSYGTGLPYQLTGYQDQVPGVLQQHDHVPLPPTHQVAPQQYGAPMAPQPMPQPMAQPMAMSPQPMMQGGSSCSSCNSGATLGQVYGAPVATPSYDYGSVAYGGGGCATGSCGGGLPLGSRWQMGGGAGACGAGGCGVAPKWFGGAGGLFFAQRDGRNVNLSNVGGVPILGTQEARIGTASGVSGNIGRYFNCGRNAIVGNYWGMFPDANQSISLDAGLRTSLPFGHPLDPLSPRPGVFYDNGVDPALDIYTMFDNSVAHRIRRDNEIHSGEINILGFGLGSAAVAQDCGSCYFGGPSVGLAPASCSRIRLGWLAGVRWLRFQDDLEYASSRTDDDFGTTNDDVYYTNGVQNDLVGFQLGGNLTYLLGKRFSIYSGTKFAVMGNHMQYDTRLGTTGLAAEIGSPNPAYNGQSYDFMSTRDSFAFLGEGDVGLSARICKGWSANVGYRAVGVSGVATAVGQIPLKFDDVNQITRINNNDSLLLHGVYFGGSYNF